MYHTHVVSVYDADQLRHKSDVRIGVVKLFYVLVLIDLLSCTHLFGAHQRYQAFNAHV